MNFQFDSLMDFLLMDGHGAYVWASYILTFTVLMVLVILPYRQKQQIAAQIRRQQRIEEQSEEN